MSSSSIDGETLQAQAARLQDLLKLRTLPIALKRFMSIEQARQVAGVRWPQSGVAFTSCQLVSRARYSGVTLGFAHDNIQPFSNCGAVLGLNQPHEDVLSGKAMTGVWFENQQAAKAHQDQMPRPPEGRYEAVVVSPLRAARLDDPEIVLFYATPAQMILFVNGLQWKNYRRIDMSITGESACADSWGRGLRTKTASLAIPCFAERRYGGVADDELLMALPPGELQVALEGLEGLARVGLRYPIVPYGVGIDPNDGLLVSYPDKTTP